MKKNRIGSLVMVTLIMASTSFAFAKEVTSGGTPVPATCNPVKSLSYRGDARVGETGLSSIDVSYSVSPCDKTIPVRVGVAVIESIPNTVVYENQDALMSDKFTVFGVKVRTSYKVVVTVYNALTNEVLSSSTIFAAAIPKGV